MVCFVVDSYDVRCQCDPAKVSCVKTDNAALTENDRFLMYASHSGHAASIRDQCTASYPLTPFPIHYWSHRLCTQTLYTQLNIKTHTHAHISSGLSKLWLITGNNKLILSSRQNWVSLLLTLLASVCCQLQLPLQF